MKTRIVNGYKLIHKPLHYGSMRTKNYEGYIYEHRYVMEKFLKRKLKTKEIVHHKDGNRQNNYIENLEITVKELHHKKPDKLCLVCKKVLAERRATRCRECANIASRKVIRPSVETLKNDIKRYSMVFIGKKYGVSDNAVRKWCKSYKLLIG